MSTAKDTKPIPKRRTIAVAVAIVVVVASSIALVVLTTMHQESRTPTGYGLFITYSKAPIAGGQQVNIVSFTKPNVAWDQVKVQVSDGTNFGEWMTNTADLDGGSAVTFNYGSKTMGGLTVWLNVTDVGGDGFVSGGDYFTVTANPVFSSTTTYTACLIYEPTGEMMGSGVAFIGA